MTVFTSAEQLLAALATSTPSVIVSDVGMPGMDGYQLIRAIRASEPRESRIPALALTAFTRAEDRKRALVAGYQAHLAKPFDIAELVLLVANLVGRSGSLLGLLDCWRHCRRGRRAALRKIP